MIRVYPRRIPGFKHTLEVKEDDGGKERNSPNKRETEGKTVSPRFTREETRDMGQAWRGALSERGYARSKKEWNKEDR